MIRATLVRTTSWGSMWYLAANRPYCHDFKISKYHLAYYRLTDWCHQWLNVNHIRKHFVATPFLLVDTGQTVIIWVFRCCHCDKYLFVTESNDDNITAWIFSATVLLRSRAQQVLSTNISQGRVMHLRCGGMSTVSIYYNNYI